MHILKIFFLQIALALPFCLQAQDLLSPPALEEKSVLGDHDYKLLVAHLDSLNKTANDTVRLYHIFKLANNLHSEELWPRYNDLLLSEAELIFQSSNNPSIIKRSKDLYSVGINNKGYLHHVHNELETALEYYKEAVNIQFEIGNEMETASSINNIGAIYFQHGQIDSSNAYYEKSKTIALKHEDYHVAAQACSNIGKNEEVQGNLARAILTYEQGLKHAKKIDDKELVAELLGRIGHVNKTNQEYDQALKYFNDALLINIEIENKVAQAQVLNNIGTVYSQINQNTEALNHFEQAEVILKQLDRKNDLAGVLGNISRVYKSLKMYDTALEYSNRGLEIRRSSNSRRGIASALTFQAEVYFEMGDYKSSQVRAEEGYKIASDIGYPQTIKEAALILSQNYEQSGNYKGALELDRIYVSMKDSVLNESNQKAIIKQQFRFENEKRAVADSIANANQMAIAKAEHQFQKEKDAQAKLILYFVLGGIVIILGISVFAFLRKRKDNALIKAQNEEVIEQKGIVEEKNKEIIDSINYAKRIQQALLKSERRVSNHLPDHFILFQPKDIVSGDFYWTLEKEDYLYLAVVDCTGHGVPGAFMSMLGIAFLNEINSSSDVLAPAEILNKLRDRVIEELSQGMGEENSKDGMDMALVRLNLKTNELVYSGAFNPLWIISPNNDIFNGADILHEDGLNLHEIRADRRPIGYSSAIQDFTDKAVQLNKGDSIYMFTDGFADQFGGPRGKKFKYKPLKKLILKLQKERMENQKEALLDTFTDWRGDYEQIDDLCFLGLSID